MMLTNISPLPYLRTLSKVCLWQQKQHFSATSTTTLPNSLTKGKCRQHLRFRRYVFAIQYHGKYFLGFPRQTHEKNERNDIEIEEIKSTTTVRRQNSLNSKQTNEMPCSIEECLHQALIKLVGKHNFENIQVSSRTDRGVHALWNTCHIDIRSRESKTKSGGKSYNTSINSDDDKDRNAEGVGWTSQDLVNGLNYYLRRDQTQNHLGKNHLNLSQNPFLRVLHVTNAPAYIPNRFHNQFPNQPKYIDWHARHNAYERTYIYRITATTPDPKNAEWGIPFEYDTAWRVYVSRKEERVANEKTIVFPKNTNGDTTPMLLNVEEMQKAAKVLTGTHDFSSFRAKKCQRSSPIVYLKKINVVQESASFIQKSRVDFEQQHQQQQHISIEIIGNAFLYRQVRYMVGCLVEVGKSNLSVNNVLDILNGKKWDRSSKTAVAPAHGLYLADVKHEYISDPAFGTEGPYNRLGDGRLI